MDVPTSVQGTILLDTSSPFFILPPLILLSIRIFKPESCYTYIHMLQMAMHRRDAWVVLYINIYKLFFFLSPFLRSRFSLSSWEKSCVRILEEVKLSFFSFSSLFSVPYNIFFFSFIFFTKYILIVSYYTYGIYPHDISFRFFFLLVFMDFPTIDGVCIAFPYTHCLPSQYNKYTCIYFIYFKTRKKCVCVFVLYNDIETSLFCCVSAQFIFPFFKLEN